MAGRILGMILAGVLLLLGWTPAPRVGGDPAQLPRAALTVVPLPTLAPPVLLQQFDTLIALYSPGLLAWQTTYSASRGGRYFQGLQSHSVIPADGTATPPDRLTTRPTDQPDTLTSFWEGAGLPAQTPYAITVNVYDGPDGRGFEVVYSAVIAGQLYNRTQNVGPERYREQAWTAAPPADN